MVRTSPFLVEELRLTPLVESLWLWDEPQPQLCDSTVGFNGAIDNGDLWTIESAPFDGDSNRDASLSIAGSHLPENQGMQKSMPPETSEKQEDHPAKRSPTKRRASKHTSEAAEKKQKPRDVERKYRHKLRDHLSELKRTVPTLRAAAEDTVDEDGKVSGLTAASNSRKPTVLAKTLEYIRHLEKINRDLLAQIEQCSCERRSCPVM